MSILHLISQDSFIVINQKLVDVFGYYEAGIVGLFASTANYNEINHPEMDGWFYVTYDKIYQRLKLTEDKAAKPIKNLEEAGIFFVKREGIPYRKYFKFNKQKLIDLLVFDSAKTSPPKNGGQGNEKTGDKGTDNPGTSKTQTREQDTQKIGSNKNINKNKELSLSQIQLLISEIIGERNFTIDGQKFVDWANNEKLKGSIKNVLKTWIENPRNQIGKSVQSNLTDKERKEMDKLCYQIRQALPSQLDYDLEFAGNIKKVGDKFVVKMAPEKVEKFKSVINKFNLGVE